MRVLVRKLKELSISSPYCLANADRELVASLVGIQLADKIKYCQKSGFCVWDGSKWVRLSKKSPIDWSTEAIDSFVNQFIVPAIKNIIFFLRFIANNGKHENWICLYRGSELLIELLSDKKWLRQVFWHVFYTELIFKETCCEHEGAMDRRYEEGRKQKTPPYSEGADAEQKPTTI